MTPLDLAQSLARSGDYKARVMAVAMVARGLSDDDGLRQGWPVGESITAAIDYLGLAGTVQPDFIKDVGDAMPTITDAMLNKGASR